MQNAKMRGVRTGGSSGDSAQGGGRLLDSRGFLFHHAHVEDGYRRHKGCRACAKGLQGISFEVEARPPVDVEVHESSGTDEKGDAASSPDSGWDALWKGYKMQGTEE